MAPQEPATCLHYLSPFQPDANADLNATSASTNKHRLVVTCVSWSCTGQTIAASYGRWGQAGTRPHGPHACGTKTPFGAGYTSCLLSVSIR